MKAYYYILTILCCVFTTGIYSQDLKSDMKKIDAVYAGSPNYSMNCDYQYFESTDAELPYSTIKGEIKKAGMVNYVKQGATETVMTTDYSIRVNNEGKTITFLPHKTGAPEANPTGIDLDSLSKFYTKVDFKKITTDIYSYSFQMKETSEYSKFEIRFDKKTFRLTKLIFYFTNVDISDDDVEKRTNPRIEVNYSKFNNKPGITEKDINYERYLVKKGKNYELKPAYANYKLNAYTL